MASNRQIEANRGNAKRSTGPRTEAGKVRSSRNAFRHGLSRSSSNNSDDEIGAIGHAGFTADILRARLEMVRICSARNALLAAFLNEPHPKLGKKLLGIGRYERKAYATHKRLLRKSVTPD